MAESDDAWVGISGPLDEVGDPDERLATEVSVKDVEVNAHRAGRLQDLSSRGHDGSDANEDWDPDERDELAHLDDAMEDPRGTPDAR